MPAIPNELSLGELGELPMRALAALAVRTARRLRPMLQNSEAFPTEAHVFQTVDDALLTAESFALDVLPSSANPQALAQQAYAKAEDVEGMGQFATYAAAHAVQIVVEATAAPYNYPEVVGGAYGAFRVAVGSTLTVMRMRGTPTEMYDVLRADFDKLYALQLGNSEMLGAPIDPSEAGPLGALWPNGAPPLEDF